MMPEICHKCRHYDIQFFEKYGGYIESCARMTWLKGYPECFETKFPRAFIKRRPR